MIINALYKLSMKNKINFLSNEVKWNPLLINNILVIVLFLELNRSKITGYK